MKDDRKRNNADHDECRDVLAPRNAKEWGLCYFDKHKEFNNREHEKKLKRVDVS